MQEILFSYSSTLKPQAPILCLNSFGKYIIYLITLAVLCMLSQVPYCAIGSSCNCMQHCLYLNTSIISRHIYLNILISNLIHTHSSGLQYVHILNPPVWIKISNSTSSYYSTYRTCSTLTQTSISRLFTILLDAYARCSQTEQLSSKTTE